MKLIKFTGIALLAGLMMASCYVDKGNYDYSDLPQITISGLKDNYTILAAIDNLTITPSIETGYDRADLEYIWELWDRENKRDTLQISSTPELDYPLTKLGQYTLYYYVKNKVTGYYTHVKTTVTVNTEFSEGFYLLKETPSGDTDLDLLLLDGRVADDIILSTQGQALGGAPRSLGIMYARPMIDPDLDEKIIANSVGVITYDRNVNVFRANDFYLSFDQSDMHYERPADEIPYKFNMGGQACEFFTSNGVYYLDPSPGSGYLSFPVGDSGASDYRGWSRAMSGMVYWDETDSRFMYTCWQENSGFVFDDPAYQTTGLTDQECVWIGGGRNNIIYAILRHKTSGSLTVYEIAADYYYTQPEVLSVTTVGAASKLNDAAIIAANELTAPYIYFVDSANELYYINMGETDGAGGLALNAVKVQETVYPSDEQVTCLSHQYYNVGGMLFNHFAVATHKDGRYNVYMYNWLAGLPNGDVQRSASGEGKVTEIRFLGTMEGYAAFDIMYDGTYGDIYDFYAMRWTR